MTTTKLAPTFDSLIAGDLASLASESRQGLPSIEDSLEFSVGGAYRDGTAGAEARRDQLLATRRLELALLPLATGRVFVHRASRIAAGTTAALAAMFVVVLVADPMLLRLAGFFIPDLTLSLIGVGTLSAALAAYVLAGLVAERMFDRRMRGALESRGDAFDDIDALAEGPIAEARALTRKLDGWATALPLIGFATCAPLFAFLSLVYAPQLSRGFDRMSTYQYLTSGGWLSGNLSFILLAMLVGSALAIIVGRACRREHREIEPSALLRTLGHWSVVPAALVSGLIVLVFLGRAVTGLGFGEVPGHAMRAFLAVGGTLAIAAPVTWIALYIRRSEHERMDAAS